MENFFKPLRIVYIALLAGQVFFLVIITALVEAGGVRLQIDLFGQLLKVIIGVIALGSVIAGAFLYRKKLGEIDPADSNSQRLEKYRAAFISRLALCEFPVLFSIILYFMTSDRFFLLSSLILIVYFIFLRPDREKIFEQLQISSIERTDKF